MFIEVVINPNAGDLEHLAMSLAYSIIYKESRAPVKTYPCPTMLYLRFVLAQRLRDWFATFEIYVMAGA